MWTDVPSPSKSLEQPQTQSVAGVPREDEGPGTVAARRRHTRPAATVVAAAPCSRRHPPPQHISIPRCVSQPMRSGPPHVNRGSGAGPWAGGPQGRGCRRGQGVVQGHRLGHRTRGPFSPSPHPFVNGSGGHKKRLGKAGVCNAWGLIAAKKRQKICHWAWVLATASQQRSPFLSEAFGCQKRPGCKCIHGGHRSGMREPVGGRLRRSGGAALSNRKDAFGDPPWTP